MTITSSTHDSLILTRASATSSREAPAEMSLLRNAHVRELYIDTSTKCCHTPDPRRASTAVRKHREVEPADLRSILDA